jgi:hypothetical protein
LGSSPATRTSVPALTTRGGNNQEPEWTWSSENQTWWGKKSGIGGWTGSQKTDMRGAGSVARAGSRGWLGYGITIPYPGYGIAHIYIY